MTLIINSDSSRGETLEIHYRNGTVVEGFVQRVSFDWEPPYVNLCKSSVYRGESSDHEIEFEDIMKVIVHRSDGTTAEHIRH